MFAAIATIAPIFGFAFEVETRRVFFYFPTGFWGWIIIGLIAGWLAGQISRGRGFGCIADIILGIVGAFVGGWIFAKLGIFGGGFWFSLAAATVGAVILVSIAHLFGGGDRR